MDEQRRRDLRASIQFGNACEGDPELTEEELDRAVEAVIALENKPGQPNSKTVAALCDRAETRALREGIPVEKALLIETKLEHEAYWAHPDRQALVPKDES